MKCCHLFSFICLIGLLLLGFNTSRVYAQGGPPLITDDPGTPQPWGWEINAAFTFEKRRSERVFETPLLDINYGFGESIQLKYEVPWLILDEPGEQSKNGLGNSMFGVKWRFFDQDQQGFDMSVYPQVDFNNSNSSRDRGLVDQGAEFALPFQLQKSFGPFSVNPEIGYIFREYFANEWKYGVAFGYEPSHEWEFLAEVAGVTGQDFEDDEFLFNFGARWTLTENYTVLMSAGRSFRDAASGEPEFICYAGIQFNF